MMTVKVVKIPKNKMLNESTFKRKPHSSAPLLLVGQLYFFYTNKETLYIMKSGQSEHFWGFCNSRRYDFSVLSWERSWGALLFRAIYTRSIGEVGPSSIKSKNSDSVGPASRIEWVLLLVK